MRRFQWQNEQNPAVRADGFTDLPRISYAVAPGVQVELLDPAGRSLATSPEGSIMVCPGTVDAGGACRVNVAADSTFNYTLRVRDGDTEVRRLMLQLVVRARTTPPGSS